MKKIFNFRVYNIGGCPFEPTSVKGKVVRKIFGNFAICY